MELKEAKRIVKRLVAKDGECNVYFFVTTCRRCSYKNMSIAVDDFVAKNGDFDLFTEITVGINKIDFPPVLALKTRVTSFDDFVRKLEKVGVCGFERSFLVEGIRIIRKNHKAFIEIGSKKEKGKDNAYLKLKKFNGIIVRNYRDLKLLKKEKMYKFVR